MWCTRRHRPLRPRLGAGLPWLPRALSRSGLIITLRLSDLDAGLSGDLADVGKDQGWQNRSRQQPAFHTHRDIRLSFHHAVSGRRRPEPGMKRKRQESGSGSHPLPDQSPASSFT
jgi:hypothetical protein